MTPKLSDAEITSGLSGLPGWSVQHGKLHRSYKFPDFPHAMGFMATCAPSIEKKNHHPEWANVYSTVTVHLVTHDSGGITQKDFEIAGLMEQIAQKLL
ncbi:MAG: 4a-hydroxytetrahydrobiopterin dehydratase [Acidobacteriota bacterium]